MWGKAIFANSLVWEVRSKKGELQAKNDWGGRDSSRSEEGVGGVGKAKAWCEGSGRDILINKTKFNLFEQRCVKKEQQQPWGESSQGSTVESATWVPLYG